MAFRALGVGIAAHQGRAVVRRRAPELRLSGGIQPRGRARGALGVAGGALPVGEDGDLGPDAAACRSSR
jgi:hypothetical protein